MSVDIEALHSRALRQAHGGPQVELSTSDEQILLDTWAGWNQRAYGIAFIIASANYRPTKDFRDPQRTYTARRIRDMTGDKTVGYRACLMVDLAAALNPKLVGEASPVQLYAIVRSPLKRFYRDDEYGPNTGGWGQLQTKVMQAGGFAKLSRADLIAICQGMHSEMEDARESRAREAEERERVRFEPESAAEGLAPVTNIAYRRQAKLSDTQPPPYPEQLALDSGAKPQPHAERRTEGGRRHEVAAEQVRPIGAIVEASRGFDEWGDQFMRVLAGQTQDAVELAFEHLYDWQLRARVLALLPAVGAKPRNIVHAATATRAELLNLLVEVAQQHASDDEAVAR